MITAGKYENESAIRLLLCTHGDELVSQMQEIMIAWKEKQEIPMRAILTGYGLPGSGMYADTLFVQGDCKIVHIVSLSQVTHFEVLNTRRMTPDLAFRQMKEMERSGGVEP